MTFMSMVVVCQALPIHDSWTGIQNALKSIKRLCHPQSVHYELVSFNNSAVTSVRIGLLSRFAERFSLLVKAKFILVLVELSLHHYDCNKEQEFVQISIVRFIC